MDNLPPYGTSLCFFNNKGGVGKTTLACNIASYIASSGARVLVVDADPQCNSTQLILQTEDCYKLYNGEYNGANTLLDVLRPIYDGEADINTHVVPLSAEDNRFKVDLIAGHPKMSLVEEKLSQSWGELTSGDVGGFRRTNWCTQLVNHFSSAYDLIVFDVGPSLGALNRTVLIGTNYFVTPMGCDIFSIMGIKNIAEWLNEWNTLYLNGVELCDRRNKGSLERYGVPRTLKNSSLFIGYTVQQYITKSKKGQRRPTVAFETILRQIPGTIESNLSKYIPSYLNVENLKLGDIPHMFSLVPLAQNANSPIHALTGKDNLVGSQYQQQQSFVEMVTQVSTRLLSNMGVDLL
ncbi:ParA family protein [Alicyclobacillus macrosporangiidus]|uniref:ParA family protein n=1 Tax=Alicyclobacillus macrosporangiidus TaxID=392015 RepID=UPI001E39224B|nr:AAA family ATPase [Alicyclobacillus macrosporangiidus]